MDKKIVVKNFSKYARFYDSYSSVQDFCASRLISKIGNGGFDKILDIGCGTGNYTGLLRERFPHAGIKAVDISKEMISIASRKLKDREIDFIIADGEAIDFKEDFDLISSNAAFQWFEDLGKAFSRYRQFLSKEGIVLFSIFGPETFRELDKSLKAFFGNGASAYAYNFANYMFIKKTLCRLFRKVKIDEVIYKEKYDSLDSLFKKIRYTGTRGNGSNGKGLWTTKTMDGLEKIYMENFGGIVATYQIFFCKGAK